MANSRTAEIRAWLRASGEDINSRGAIPERLREKFYAEFPGKRPRGEVTPMPGPDATDDEIDEWESLGVIEPDEAAEAPESHEEPRRRPPWTGSQDGPPEPPTVDPGPAHGRKDWRKPKSAPKGSRVTAGIRTDINAKISLALHVPGSIWAARDPACGGAFMQQQPDIANALTDIVCQSPDLVAWFTGSGGQFMLWLNLGMACWPVVTVIMAHHVYHSLEQAEDPQQPNYSEYAA